MVFTRSKLSEPSKEELIEELLSFDNLSQKINDLTKKIGRFRIKIWSCFFRVADFQNLEFIITQTNYWFGVIIPGQFSIFEKRKDWDLPSSSRGIKQWIRKTSLQSAVLDRKWGTSRWSWRMSPSQEQRKCHHQIQKQKTEVKSYKQQENNEEQI